MGTDIHIAVEVIDRKTNKWKRVIGPSYTYSNRNCFLFTLLAGVRCIDGVTVMSPPKGLPEDIDMMGYKTFQEVVNCPFDDWLGEHSFSYFTFHDLLRFDWESEKHNDKLYEFRIWLESFSYTNLGFIDNKNKRIVFGFDS